MRKENRAFNENCLDAMKRTPDKYYDLAIVDPPYGIGIASNPVRQKHSRKAWDSSPPPTEYFSELFRISKNQVIWGGNYFELPPCKGFLIWDKKQPFDFTLAMCEFAWTSFNKPAKMFSYSVMSERGKIHPTQKPVALYEWILKNYAETGDKILDTHLGSGSSRIAAYNLDFDFTGYEIDADYFKAQEERFTQHTAQFTLFDV